MNHSGSQWRKEIAKLVAKSYAVHPNVDGIFLSGSTARNHADRFSDIELGVVWKTPPTDTERNELAHQTGGDVLRLYPPEENGQLWSDDLMIGRRAVDEVNSGVLVEVVNFTGQFAETIMNDVLIKLDPDEEKQNFISGIFDGIPLKSSDTLTHWKESALRYPDELAVAVVRRYSQIDHFWRWQMWLERGPNWIMFYKSITQVEEKILHTLLGLNKIYYFGFKWLDIVTERMVIQPDRLAQRLKDVYHLPSEQAIADLIALVDETYDLIERRMPAIDIKRLKQIFHYQRPIWDEPPFQLEN